MLLQESSNCLSSEPEYSVGRSSDLMNKRERVSPRQSDF